MDQERILVVEDDRQMRQLLNTYLTIQGYCVAAFATAEEALDQFRQGPADLVILDMFLPGMDGLDFCQELRRRSLVPVLMLSGLSSLETRVRAFQIGADAFLTKPFSLPVLAAHIRALMRRGRSTQATTSSSTLVAGPIALDPERREVRVRGETVDFTPLEYDGLKYLMARQEQVVTPEDLLRSVWNYTYPEPVQSTAVVVLMYRLRAKIEQVPARPVHLVTVPEQGYKLTAFPTAGAGYDPLPS
jgi:two-component system, OmpR family, response regulator RegX3